MGTYGSRSLVVGGSALVQGDRQGHPERQEDRRASAGGERAATSVRGWPFQRRRHRPQPRLRGYRLSAYVPHDFPLEILEPGLEEQAFYDPVNFSFPGGAHIAEVEIDRETGRVRLLSYTAVDDIGTVINPMIVAGQLHGGIVQGAGQALCENAVYDEASGQLLSGSFMDYCMPRADMLPQHDHRDPQHALRAQRSGRERAAARSAPSARRPPSPTRSSMRSRRLA